MRLRLEIEPCENIQDACREAQRVADLTQTDCEFEFNGVDCVAVPGGNPITLHSRQHDAQNTHPRVTSRDDD